MLAASRRLAAAVRRRDKGSVEKFLAREFSFIDAAGKPHARRAVLANLKPAPRSDGGSPKSRLYGRVALISGALKSAQAKTRNDLFAVDVWVKGEDGWKALIHHDNVLAATNSPRAHPPSHPRPRDARPPECKNPLDAVPHEPHSQAEREVIAAFQTMERAVTHNDADEWVKHVADEFVVYRTGQHPTTKDGRVAFIRAQAAVNGETWVAEISWMKLWAFPDVVVMRADHVMPGNRRPPYRATRIWIKRDGRWQMAVSQQTTIVGAA